MAKPPALKPAEYEEIHARLDNWRANSPKALAAEFGVSVGLIYEIGRGYRPKSITPEESCDDEKKIGGVVRAMKGDTTIPGVRVWAEKVPAASAA